MAILEPLTNLLRPRMNPKLSARLSAKLGPMSILRTHFLLICFLLASGLMSAEAPTAPDYHTLVEALTKVDHPDVARCRVQLHR